MRMLHVVQGSDEWRAIRTRYRCASDASAMMGVSPHISRREFLRMQATGDERQFSDWARKNIIEKGHTIEVAARAFVEGMLGEELFPVTAVCDDEYLLASYDGLVMSGSFGFECKSWNKALVEMVRNKDLSPAYYWQLEQQIAVGKLDKVIFCVTDGTRENFLWMEYRAVPGRYEQLMAGWKQFDEDVKNYQHVEIVPVHEVANIDSLPELLVTVVGEVQSTNLATWRDVVVGRIKAINTDLRTDEDFAIADKTVKFLEDGEKKLEYAKSQVLAQTASIDDLFKTVDSLKEEMRSKRLTLEKSVKARKETIRADIVSEGRKELDRHRATLNQRLPRPFMPEIQADLLGVIKGKKTITGLRDAIDSEVTRAKIAASTLADQIQINLNALVELAPDHGALFPDIQSLCLKAADDFLAAVKTRVSDWMIKEEERLARIRAEEQKRNETLAQVAPQIAKPVARTQTVERVAPKPAVGVRAPKVHEIKIWPSEYQAVISLHKTHEVRRFDRDYIVGDTLRLKEWSPESEEYTGRVKDALVTYITQPGTFGLPADVGVMSIDLGCQ